MHPAQNTTHSLLHLFFFSIFRSRAQNILTPPFFFNSHFFFNSVHPSQNTTHSCLHPFFFLIFHSPAQNTLTLPFFLIHHSPFFFKPFFSLLTASSQSSLLTVSLYFTQFVFLHTLPPSVLPLLLVSFISPFYFQWKRVMENLGDLWWMDMEGVATRKVSPDIKKGSDTNCTTFC